MKNNKLLIFQDMRPKDIETIDEMIEKNFTVYVDNGLGFDLLRHMEFMQRFKQLLRPQNQNFNFFPSQSFSCEIQSKLGKLHVQKLDRRIKTSFLCEM